MHKSASTTAVSEPTPLSFFERAKQRVFGKRDAATPTAAAPVRVANPAAAMTRAIAEEKRNLGAYPQPAAAVKPPVSVVRTAPVGASFPQQSATQSPYPKADVGLLIKIVTERVKTPDADRARSAEELQARGFIVAGNSVTVERDHFGQLSPKSQGEVLRAGAKIGERKARPTPTEEAQAMELTFPPEPKKTRTWQQLMNLADSEVKKITEETADDYSGRERRREIWDAFDSQSPTHWNNPDWSHSKDTRMAFYKKFSDAISYCILYGPSESTPNDPAPPIDPKAMTAGQWFALGASVRAGLLAKMQLKEPGRLIRAELKRAYQSASSTERMALLVDFGNGLRAFPEEFI